MSPDDAVREAVERAADAVAPAWPLHSFVTANPLAGVADRPFHRAVADGSRLFGGDGYPSADVFRRAWESDRIDPGRLRAALDDAGYEAAPEALLARMASETDGEAGPTADALDRLTTKWLAAFLDEGRAKWPMPDREAGFYRAVRAVARHDAEIPDRSVVTDLPDDPVEALADLLADHPRDRWTEIAEHHLTALPGWTGLVKRRAEADGDWQSTHPITLPGYLAVRLALAEALDAPAAPPADDERDASDGAVPLREAWLRAWEESYRAELVGAVADASESLPADDADRPDAQLAFCIDTRSEIVRRHVEAAGAYETHGYAGFFGVPMRYEGYGADAAVDSHPPILDTKHRVADRPAGDDRQAVHDRVTGALDAGTTLVERLRSNAATAFGFVESAGSGYGAALVARTLAPTRVRDALAALDDYTPDVHEFCAPTVDHDPGGDGDLPLGMTHEERVEYAATAFELTGWTAFARVVVFVGHASETSNNPFGASLDCGACAGNPGGPNARVLAAICNDEAVRASLRDRGIEVPDDTVFVAGEHNTTTDEVELYADHVPPSHEADVASLRADLAAAREAAAAERAADLGAAGDARETERRAADWAETRPEWGLAGNAALVVGPRALTDDLDLDGRAFLHSYDPRTDDDGSALEAIVGGPMLVAQWINAQYYFATVDTAAYGSGSKITQNPVGNVGVYQGPGGDLLTGLPRQSVAGPDGTPYHQPLRLSTVVYAPVDRVTDALDANETVRGLLDGGWLSLTVVDPADDGVYRYDGDLSWTSARETLAPRPAVADD